MTDHNVIFNCFCTIGEAGQIRIAVIRRIGPAVGLDTDGDVDLRHLQSAADVPEGIVFRACVLAARHRILGRNGSHAGIDTAVVSFVIRVVKDEANPRQAFALRQTLHKDLARQLSGLLQRFAIILLLEAGRGNGDLLLIEEGKFKSAVFCNRFSDLIISARLRTVVNLAFYCLVEFPAGDGRAGQGESLAHLQVLHVCGHANRITVHVNKVDGNFRILEAGIVEIEHIALRRGSQNKSLFNRVRVEFQILQLGMAFTKRSVIHRLGQFDDRRGIAGNASNNRLFRHRDIPRILSRIEDILDSIAGGLRLRTVEKCYFVAFCPQRQGFGAFVGTIASHSDGRLGDDLVNDKVRVRYDFVGSHRIMSIGIIHIMDDVFQRGPLPVRIHRGVLLDQHAEVKQIIAIRCGVPAVEDVARLGGCAGVRRLLVLFDRLIRKQIRRSGFTVYKADREARRVPLGVEHQVGRRHLVEGVRRRQAGIGIPAGEGVVAVHAALGCGRRPDVRGLVDVRVELNTLDRVEQIAAVVVVDLERISIIIEIVLRHTTCARIAVIVGITRNLLCTEVAAGAGVRLAVFFRQRIAVIVRVLQPIIDGIGIGIACPLRDIGDRGAVVGQHLRRNERTLCNISGILLLVQPAVEGNIAPPVITIVSTCNVARPGRGDILAQFHRHRVVQQSGAGDVLAGQRCFYIIIVVVVVVLTGVELERILFQFIVHEQNGRTIRRNHNAGCCVLCSILFPALLGLVRDAAVGGMYRAADRAVPGLGVVVHEGGLRAGVVILLEHVDDRIIDRIARPLRIERGVAVDCDGIARRLGEGLIQIPCVEGIAVTGRDGGGDRLLGAVGHCYATDIAAALAVIGQLEVLAGIFDDQLLARSLGDVSAFGELQHRIVKGLDGGGHIAVQNAVNMLSGTSNLGIAFAFEILQFVDKVIFSGERNVLDPDGAFLFRIEIRRLYFNRRCLRIIDGSAGDLVGIGLRRSRSRDSIGQFAALHLHEVSIEDDFTVSADIVILRGDVVDIDRAEYRDDSYALGNDRFSINNSFGILNNPLFKNLTGYKGILRHSADGLACIPEILRQTLLCSIFLLNDESDKQHVFEHGRNGHVASHCCSVDNIISVFVDPLFKILALNSGIGGQFQCVTFIICFSLIDIVFIACVCNLVGNSKDVRIILSPNVHIGCDSDIIVEVSAAVYPFPVITVPCRYRWNTIQAIACIDIDRSGCNSLSLVFIRIESNGISDLVIIRNDVQVGNDNKAFINSITSRPFSLLPFTAAGVNTDGPKRDVILAVDSGRESADRLLVIDHASVNHTFTVSSTEGDRPNLDESGSQRNVLLRRERRLNFVIPIKPAVKAIPFFG